MKKVISIAVTAVLGLAALMVPVSMKAEVIEGVNVKLDGKLIGFPDAQPYVNEDERTLVPVRFVSEAMGCKVEWEESRELVTITKAPYRILLRIGENSAIVNDGKSDVKKEFDTQAVLKGDRTFVPLRFVSETLGAGVAWDEVNNTVILRSDGTVEVVATPTPAPTPTQIPAIPIPTGEPGPNNAIPGNPYYIYGLTKDDLDRFVNLQGLLKYDDIIYISGDDNGTDSGRLDVGYGCYNPYQKRYQGYLTVDARESGFMWKISISKNGDKEIQRLKEVINIAVPGTQDFKDFVFNSMLECKTTGKKTLEYGGQKFFIRGDYTDLTRTIWGDESFFVTAWW